MKKICCIQFLLLSCFIVSPSYAAIGNMIKVAMNKYQREVEQKKISLPVNQQYLAPLLTRCNYTMMHAELSKNPDELLENDQEARRLIIEFIKDHANAIIASLSKLLLNIFNYAFALNDELTEQEKKVFFNLFQHLQATNFFQEQNKLIAQTVDTQNLFDRLYNVERHADTTINMDLATIKKVISHIKPLLQSFFVDTQKRTAPVVETKKNVVHPSVNQLMQEAVPQLSNIILAAGKAQVEKVKHVFSEQEKELLQSIEQSFNIARDDYKKRIAARKEGLLPKEKYLAYLFEQFDFKSLYLYEFAKREDYFSQTVIFLNQATVKNSIERRIKSRLRVVVVSLQTLIDRAFQKYITQQGSLTEKEERAYAFLYELIKDVLCYQMALKDLTKDISLFDSLLKKLEGYYQEIERLKSDDSSKKAFLEPLYQMFYFFQSIQLIVTDYEKNIGIIKKLYSAVQRPSDPDLENKFIKFAREFATSNAPAPVIWLGRWAVEIATVVAQHSLVFALKAIYQVEVDTTKSSRVQATQAIAQVAQKKIPVPALLQKVGAQYLVNKGTETGVETMLTGVEKQFASLVAPPKPMETSGFVVPLEQKKEISQENIAPSSDQGRAVKESLPAQVSFFQSIKNYIASWFSWMWK